VRNRKNRGVRLVVAATFVALLATVLVAGTGCSALDSEPEYDTVTDFGGKYHFLVPQGWQSVADSSILAVYASEELPGENEPLDVLSIVVLSGETVEDTPPADMLPAFVEARSVAREWSEAVISEPTSITVGGRPGIVIEVTALDSTGVPFEARFIQVRTAGTDFVIVAVMPGEDFEQAGTELDGIVERWYWHVPADNSAEETPTAEAETTE